MNKFLIAAAALSLAAPSLAFAQPSHHERDGHNAEQNHQQHPGWGQDHNGGHRYRSGEHLGYNDWNGAKPVDYREHHLRQPPHGYEWRESNGQFILGGLAGGLVASAVVAR
jgi:Ni/Co efflux regulator RcnB